MVTVGRVVDIFRGRLTLPEGEVLDVEVEVTVDIVRILAGGSSIGAWPIRYCRVSPRNDRVFDVSIDGEMVVFEPADSPRFAMAAASLFVSSSLADRISVVKRLPSAGVPEKSVESVEPDPVPRLDSGRMIAGAGGAAALIALISFFLLGGDPEPTLPPPSQTIVTFAPQPPGWGELSPESFTERWNSTAAELGVSAPLPTRGVEDGFAVSVSEWIYVQGVIGENGTMDRLVISADPSGPPESDAMVLLVWGLAIATVDPSASPGERRAIIDSLGVDIDDPNLDEVDRAVEVEGNRYSMQYFPGFSSVLFQIEAP